MKALVPSGNVQTLVRFAAVAEPEPATDEVVVQVESFSINRGEMYLLENPKLGWRPGKDVAGQVVRTAADGSGPSLGARVVGHPPACGWASCAAHGRVGRGRALLRRARHIGSVAPWEETAALLADLRARRLLGKAVLEL